MDAKPVSIQLRLDRQLKETLAEIAQKNFRSLNNEINSRLVASLAAEKEKALIA